MQIELLLHYTWLNDRPLLFLVHFEDAVEILRHVDDNGFTNGLPRQAGTRAARKHRNFKIARDFHRGENIFVAAWQNDADGFYFIDAGIGAVHKAGYAVETDLTANTRLQCLIKIVIHRKGG